MARERETRIDLLRGIALLLIFVGHSDFSFSEVFRNARGFSDASEMFVLLAGISAALAYYAPASSSAQWLWHKPWKRALQLYRVHMVLFALVAAVSAIAVLVPGHASDTILHALESGGFWTMARLNLARAIWLMYMPGNLDILPLYMLLLLVAPVIFRLHDRSQPLLAGLSVVIWIVAGAGHINFTNAALPGGHWYFNPLSWQLIFITGIFIGIRIKTGKAVFPYNRALFILAAAFCLAAIPANILFHFNLVEPPFSQHYQEMISKTNCGPLRLVNTLAILYLAWNIRAVHIASVHPSFRLLCIAGKHSLPVFVTGVLLSNAILILMLLRPQTSIALQLALLLIGCAAQLAVGQYFELRKQRIAARQTARQGLYA